jgi:hypothetical protein
MHAVKQVFYTLQPMYQDGRQRSEHWDDQEEDVTYPISRIQCVRISAIESRQTQVRETEPGATAGNP